MRSRALLGFTESYTKDGGESARHFGGAQLALVGSWAEGRARQQRTVHQGHAQLLIPDAPPSRAQSATAGLPLLLVSALKVLAQGNVDDVLARDTQIFHFRLELAVPVV